MNPLILWFLCVLTLYRRSESGTPRSSVWFEPNRGQVLGQTQFVGRTQGAFLYLTGAETVFGRPPDKIEHKAKMRQVKMAFVGASLLAVGVGEDVGPKGIPWLRLPACRCCPLSAVPGRKRVHFTNCFD